MQPEHWDQVKNIFEQAMTLAPDKRLEFLDKVCSDNEKIRNEVEELLRSFDDSQSFLETPVIAKKKNEFTSGQQFAQYEIIEPIGVGGMGEVFLARDTKLKRKAALKILPAEFTDDKERLQRFEQEARSASSLNHPNILTIYEIGEHNGVSFIATEFIDGETLRRHINQKDLTFQEILDIASQTASALAAAHDAGIIHRDIKPENIMLRRDRIVKILDFGLAKPLKPETFDPEQSTQALLETQKGVVMGTVAYMSPEQARGKAVDTRTDIWSLGVVLYEIIAGRVPFEGETASDVIAAILKTKPVPLPGQTPAELQRIVDKTLRRNKEERYQTAKDLLVDLKNLKQDLDFDEKFERKNISSADEPKSFLQTNAQVHTTAKIQNRKLPFILAIIALIIAVSAIGYYFLQSKSQPKPNLADEAVKIDSLAVLPFENSVPENEYLADGITESLINSMSNLSSLRVVSRSTVFNFKNTKETPLTIGKTLNVKAILTGKITQQNDSLIIQVDLIDVDKNSEISGKKFVFKMSDLPDVPEQIAAQVTDNLQLKLNSQQKAQITKHYTENSEAYSEYLKGRYYTLEFTPDSHTKALAHLNRAIEIDPTYALAYAGIADAYTTASDWLLPPSEALTKAKAAAQKALDLDNELPEAWAARGHARLHEWDKSAIDDLNKAIALAPKSLTNYAWLGEYYMIFDVEKSVPVLQKAAELDPLSPLPYAFLSFDYYMLRQPQKSLEAGKKAEEISPEYFTECTYMARFYASMGDFKSAENELNKIPPEAVDVQAISTKGIIFAMQGKRQEAEKILAQMQKLSDAQYVSPFEFAFIYLKLNDRDKTFYYLEKAFTDRSEALGFIRNMPDFEPIRDDPRYAELMRKIGFTQ